MHPADHIAARLAVERGWLSQETINAALRDVDRQNGGSSPALPAVLHDRGLLTGAQRRELEHEQGRHARLLERFSEIRRLDTIFGRKLAEEAVLPTNRVDECLFLQKLESDQGRIRRLGALLVERGAIDRGTLLEILRKARIEKLNCPLCAVEVDFEATPESVMTCPRCGGPLVEDETLTLLRRDSPKKPEEVGLAERLPDRECGKFVLVQHLGTGGMGSVWKAWDRDLGRYVAIKFLRTVEDPVRRDEDVRRFLREGAMAARLRHPNIVAVYESGEGRGTHFLVMEYVEGKALNQTRVPVSQAVRIVRDVARALQYAHDAGVVHRDIKPSNLMIGPDGRPFLMDFGLARLAETAQQATLTKTGFVLGTPMYMSPEQAMGGRTRQDRLSDQYSLGATLYDLLTGRPPFEADDPWDVIADVIHHEPVAPRKRNPKIPRDVETITLKAMRKRAADRYASVGDLADDLDRYLKGEPIRARPVPLVERAWRGLVRNRRATLIAACGVSGALVLAVVLAGYRASEAQKAQEAEAQRILRPAREKMLGLKAEWPKLVELVREHDRLPDETSDERRQELRSRISAKELEINQLFVDGLQECNRVWLSETTRAEGRKIQGELLWERFLLAEQRADPNAGHFEDLVRGHDDPAYREELDRPATINVFSNPAGASVTYFKLVDQPDGRRVRRPDARELGTTPIRGAMIPRGSGILELTRKEYRKVIHPVLARRGEQRELRVNLYTDEEIGEGFIYVPAGPFIAGGDPAVPRPSPRREVTVGDFFISAGEVTLEEYAEFLRHFVERKASAPHIPRDIHGDILTLWMSLDFDPIEEYAKRPVTGIMHSSAVAYCDWRSQRDGRQFALPSSAQWEKAARGVDGRLYPWGNGFSWRFTNGGALPGGPIPDSLKPADAAESDVSVYGVRHLAGNVSEWCSNPLESPEVFETRGGSVGISTSWNFKCTTGRGVEGFQRIPVQGFRPVVTPVR